MKRIFQEIIPDKKTRVLTAIVMIPFLIFVCFVGFKISYWGITGMPTVSYDCIGFEGHMPCPPEVLEQRQKGWRERTISGLGSCYSDLPERIGTTWETVIIGYCVEKTGFISPPFQFPLCCLPDSPP